MPKPPDYRHDSPLTRAKAIRAKCVECCAGDKAAVKGCEMWDCPLWPYRSGRLKAK